jgi:hypothetical protein
MIQFNLLPDVKIQYIKAKRMKRTVTTIAVLAAGVSLFVMVSLFLLINVAQKKHLEDLTKDIAKKTSDIQKTEGISKIVTIQNQLQSLDQAHEKKPVTSRLSGYIETITPANVTVSKLEVNFVDGNMELSGKAEQLANINKFVDTIKFTKYSVKDVEGEKDAFSNVVLDAFEKTEEGITYTIKFNFDLTIFDTKSDVKINVPTITTNRSATEKPPALFQSSPLPNNDEEEQ